MVVVKCLILAVCVCEAGVSSSVCVRWPCITATRCGCHRGTHTHVTGALCCEEAVCRHINGVD